MQEVGYTLTIPNDNRRLLSVSWLWLCVLALFGAGVFSLLLVLSRTPYIQDVFPWVDFFHTALVVHVDLSVLVWSLAFAGVLWSLNSKPRYMGVAWAAFILAVLGTLIIVISPFTGAGDALMSNYIPVLRDPVFFAGLLTFALGFSLLVLHCMTACPPVGPWMTGEASLRFGLNAAAVSAAVALGIFVWTYVELPQYLTGQSFYERLFWGGGHVLQFTYTLLMLVAWLWLSTAAGIRLPISPRVVLLILFFGLFCVFLAPLIQLVYPPTTAENIVLYTWLMSYGGSLATLPLGAAILMGLLNDRSHTDEQKIARFALISSPLLFGVGGVIGFMIQGSNVTIPAHYHGSIVGVSLALMGLTYSLLPKLGYPINDIKTTKWQPWAYGGGQLMHIMGLVWSGGYGVQRKVAGAAQQLDSIERVVGMGFMGLGGLISSIGGVLFIIVVLRALTRKGDTEVAAAKLAGN